MDLEHSGYLGDAEGVCPYLPDRMAVLQYIDGRFAAQNYREMMDRGYRRFGREVYRPVCAACSECKVLRVPVSGFKPSREQRRIRRKGDAVFQSRLTRPAFSAEKFALHQRYVRAQHNDLTEDFDECRYRRFMVETCLGPATIEHQFHVEGRLAGFGILDLVGDALSSVYFSFHPEFAAYRLGTYSILQEIDLAARWGLSFYYPGYFITGCKAMNYKARFRPCEVKDLDGTAWSTIA